MCVKQKDIKSRPTSVDGIKITLWNEPEKEFTIRQLMMEMGFFVLLHLNSDHLESQRIAVGLDRWESKYQGCGGDSKSRRMQKQNVMLVF